MAKYREKSEVVDATKDVITGDWKITSTNGRVETIPEEVFLRHFDPVEPVEAPRPTGNVVYQDPETLQPVQNDPA